MSLTIWGGGADGARDMFAEVMVHIVATPLGSFFKKGQDLKLNMGNHFTYTCIRHSCIKGVALTRLTMPLGFRI